LVDHLLTRRIAALQSESWTERGFSGFSNGSTPLSKAIRSSTFVEEPRSCRWDSRGEARWISTFIAFLMERFDLKEADLLEAYGRLPERFQRDVVMADNLRYELEDL